jgi:hypothetical protein
MSGAGVSLSHRTQRVHQAGRPLGRSYAVWTSRDLMGSRRHLDLMITLHDDLSLFARSTRRKELGSALASALEVCAEMGALFTA